MPHHSEVNTVARLSFLRLVWTFILILQSLVLKSSMICADDTITNPAYPNYAAKKGASGKRTNNSVFFGNNRKRNYHSKGQGIGQGIGRGLRGDNQSHNHHNHRRRADEDFVDCLVTKANHFEDLDYDNHYDEVPTYHPHQMKSVQRRTRGRGSGSSSSSSSSITNYKWFCIADTNNENHLTSLYRLVGDIELFFQNYTLHSQKLRLEVPYSYIDFESNHINLDTDHSTDVSIFIIEQQLFRDDATTGTAEDPSKNFFKGDYKALIIRVQDNIDNDNVVPQSEDRLYNDFFDDENNLRSRYLECSNHQLSFEPATGSNVNNGVVTVTLNYNISGRKWYWVAERALQALNNMAGIDEADYGVFVLPKTVDFEGAIAYGYTPGIFTFFKAFAASIPLVQVHEFGHNLGFQHSGKNLSNGSSNNDIADQTCSMGSTPIGFDDVGISMCFNGAKLWYTGWYSDHHHLVQPHKNGFAGKLIGIDDIVQNSVVDNRNKVVVKIIGPNESDLHVIYQRKKGVIEGIPEDGDSVVITEQDGLNGQSWWIDALQLGESLVYEDWSGSGFDLIIEVCFVTMDTLDTVYLLIYVQGVTDMSCPEPTESPSLFPTETSIPSAYPSAYPSAHPSSNPTSLPTLSPTSFPTLSPTLSPTAFPTLSPTLSPTAFPTLSPTLSPTSFPTLSPTLSPTFSPTSFPTLSPTSSPTLSPTSSPTLSPTSSPTLSPTISPTFPPTISPTFPPTISPTSSPTLSPVTNGEDPQERFIISERMNTSGVVEPVSKSCRWLSSRTNRNKKKICSNKKYQIYSEARNLGPASQVCKKSCSGYCVLEFDSARFVVDAKVDNQGQEVVTTRTCRWLSKQIDAMQTEICGKFVENKSIFGQASEICTQTCNSCYYPKNIFES